MKLFECQNCGQLIYFENIQCERCGMALGFLPDAAIMTALQPNEDGATYTPLAERSRNVVYCANQAHAACNWLVDAGGEAFCAACRLNRTIPDLTIPENLSRWQRMEVAKRRLIYSLMRLDLPLENKTGAPETGLAFDFLAPPPSEDGQGQIMTGHDNGVIAINVAEADDEVRTSIRAAMGEPYRTLLGHLRHEIGHYYWMRLVQGTANAALFREMFGNETADYAAALQAHYQNGAPENWQDRHISAYASAHPHEDWAETFAHYLHMVDTLETAYAFGLRVRPRAGQDDNLATAISTDPYRQDSIDSIIEGWLPLIFAVNSINRSMGIDDLYPFVISPPVIDKLKAVHHVVTVKNNNKPSLGKRLRNMVSWSSLS